jgi:hypothetical protein
MKRSAAVVAASLSLGIVTSFLTVTASTPAQAANCPPASVGGRTVATVTVDDREVPVKAVTFVNGGPLIPPATNRAAGISVRNRPLGAKKGASVIIWHVRFGPGCPGALNALTTMPLGSTFAVAKVGGAPTTYEIAAREMVTKGTVKRAWFRNGGLRRLVLITCADFTGGVFRGTTAVIAVPVSAPLPQKAAATPPHGAAPTD